MATAVRLSASFPYVSPSARSNGLPPHYPDWHLVDGGYYDNYGIFTLLDWLDAALMDRVTPPKRIVIVRITSFPDSTPAAGSVRGWGFQAQAPLDAFLHVRTTAQFAESMGQLNLYEENWQTKQVDIVDLAIQYPNGLGPECADPPLSWKLTGAQQTCIDQAWAAKSVQDAAQEVLRLITGGADAIH